MLLQGDLLMEGAGGGGNSPAWEAGNAIMGTAHSNCERTNAFFKTAESQLNGLENAIIQDPLL